jgi:hypothetical protein
MTPDESPKRFRMQCTRLLTQLRTDVSALHALIGDHHLLEDDTQSLGDYIGNAAPAITTANIVHVDTIFQGNLQTIRMTPGDAPKASIVDFVMVVTGKDNNMTGEVIRLLKKKEPMWFQNCERFQFPGARQKEQFVLDAMEAIHLLMILPGRSAMMFRVECVQLLTRIFAGDPTLHALLEENHLLGDATQSFCNYLDAAAPAIMAAAALEDKEYPHTICKEWIHDNIQCISFAASKCPTCSTCIPRDVSFAHATSTMEQIIPGTNYRADVLVRLENNSYVAVEVAHTHLTSSKRSFECKEVGVVTYEVETSVVQPAMDSGERVYMLWTTKTRMRKCVSCV